MAKKTTNTRNKRTAKTAELDENSVKLTKINVFSDVSSPSDVSNDPKANEIQKPKGGNSSENRPTAQNEPEKAKIEQIKVQNVQIKSQNEPKKRQKVKKEKTEIANEPNLEEYEKMSEDVPKIDEEIVQNIEETQQKKDEENSSKPRPIRRYSDSVRKEKAKKLNIQTYIPPETKKEEKITKQRSYRKKNEDKCASLPLGSDDAYPQSSSSSHSAVRSTPKRWRKDTDEKEHERRKIAKNFGSEQIETTQVASQAREFQRLQRTLDSQDNFYRYRPDLEPNVQGETHYPFVSQYHSSTRNETSNIHSNSPSQNDYNKRSREYFNQRYEQMPQNHHRTQQSQPIIKDYSQYTNQQYIKSPSNTPPNYYSDFYHSSQQNWPQYSERFTNVPEASYQRPIQQKYQNVDQNSRKAYVNEKLNQFIPSETPKKDTQKGKKMSNSQATHFMNERNKEGQNIQQKPREELSQPNTDENSTVLKKSQKNIPEKVNEQIVERPEQNLNETQVNENKRSWLAILWSHRFIIFGVAVVIFGFLADEWQNKMKPIDLLRPRVRKMHKFVEIESKSDLKTVFDQNWLLVIETKGEPELDIVPYLYQINVARINLNTFNKLWLMDLLFEKNLSIFLDESREKSTLTFFIKNSALFTHDDQLIRIIDLEQKPDFINCLDLSAKKIRKMVIERIKRIFYRIRV